MVFVAMIVVVVMMVFVAMIVVVVMMVFVAMIVVVVMIVVVLVVMMVVVALILVVVMMVLVVVFSLFHILTEVYFHPAITIDNKITIKIQRTSDIECINAVHCLICSLCITFLKI